VLQQAPQRDHHGTLDIGVLHTPVAYLPQMGGNTLKKYRTLADW
jgi:hypothetical protein